jgi:hypothetical protein
MMEAFGMLSCLGVRHPYRGPVEIPGSYHELSHGNQ